MCAQGGQAHEAGGGGSHCLALAFQLSASQMVPGGELAGDTLAEVPFPCTVHRATQGPGASGCSALPRRQAAQPKPMEAGVASPGSAACVCQPPEQGQVGHLASYLPRLLPFPQLPSEREREGLSQNPAPPAWPEFISFFSENSSS